MRLQIKVVFLIICALVQYSNCSADEKPKDPLGYEGVYIRCVGECKLSQMVESTEDEKGEPRFRIVSEFLEIKLKKNDDNTKTIKFVTTGDLFEATLLADRFVLKWNEKNSLYEIRAFNKNTTLYRIDIRSKTFSVNPDRA